MPSHDGHAIASASGRERAYECTMDGSNERRDNAEHWNDWGPLDGPSAKQHHHQRTANCFHPAFSFS